MDRKGRKYTSKPLDVPLALIYYCDSLLEIAHEVRQNYIPTKDVQSKPYLPTESSLVPIPEVIHIGLKISSADMDLFRAIQDNTALINALKAFNSRSNGGN